jgi:hypothetical protein
MNSCLAKRRLRLADLPAEDCTLDLLEDRQLFAFRLEGDERVEKFRLQPADIAALDDHEHVAATHGVAEVLLNPPHASRHTR